ncbi:MAG: PPC domain-containing protein [Cyanobacteria bacterium P01_A01_bin.116]
MKNTLAGTVVLSLAAIALFPTQASAATLLQRVCQLDATDDTLSDESLFDRHLFTATAGQSVTVSLSSSDFDPYILLLDANNETLGENDDISQRNLNSRLTVTLPSNGQYSILANSQSNLGLGRYRLTITSPTHTEQRPTKLPTDCR